MKFKTTLSLMFVLFMGLSAYSQTEKILEPGSEFLNVMIMSDTASDGSREETIYILRRNSEYLVSGAFENYGWKLHIKAEDGDGERPIVRAYPDENGNVPWAMTGLHGDLELESLFIDGQPSDTEQPPVAWPFVSNAEGATLIIEDCIFVNAGQGAIGVWNAAEYVKINNCKFYNMGNISFLDLGNGRLIDCRSSQVDQLIITNNTIVNSIDRIIRHRGGSGVLKEVVFDHNTIVNNASYHGFIELGNVGNSIQITNNLIVDGMALGADQSDLTRLSELDAHGETDDSGNPLMVWVGSIPNDTTSFTISKNIYTVSSEIQEFYTAESVDEGPNQILTNHIKVKLGDDSTSAWVKQDVTLENIPGSLAELCTWYYSPTGANKQKVTTTEVDYDRRSYEYWLDTLDCNYAVADIDDFLGTDGVAVGDTNWKASEITGVQKISVEELEFNNYPNPFSNYTTLQFNLEQSSEVTIEISDITGKSVRQINAGTFAPGLNNVIIQKGNISPGVYILRIAAGKQFGINKIVIK